MPEIEELSFQRITSLLKAQQEASLDGILVVDEGRKILSYNRRFLELWQIPPDLAQTMEDRVLLGYVLGALVDADAFLARVMHLYDHPDEVSRDELRLRDGRVLDRYSAPVTSGEGQHLGRVWFFRDVTSERLAEEALEKEKARSEALLRNILPDVIAERLKAGELVVADDFAEVTVLFADVVGFTEFSNRTPAHRVVDFLNDMFSRFDLIAQAYGTEKIKTIGDAYMAVAGLPLILTDHADRVAGMALDMMAGLVEFNQKTGQQFQIRIGIHSGPVVAGVIGIKKFIYDLWGDTVNTASRMESHGVPGAIQISGHTRQLLGDRFRCSPRGTIHVKGLGEMETWLLEGRR
ncbi:MAG: adenylate/guanylate cyclase domain-containing protein [Candidatus Xenobia bacterium]